MKTEKNRKLHGSVLLTVVAVMALLIIFMTGTLVLANAANRRSHRSYTSNQAQYTAKTAIDAFYRTTVENETIRDAVLALDETSDPVYPAINFGAAGDAGLGRLIDPDGTGHDGCLRVEMLRNPDGSPHLEYKWDASTADEHGDPVTPHWVEFHVYRATATVQVGQRGAIKTMYQDFLGDPILHIITIPPTPPGPSPTAPEGFQTIGDSAFNTTGSTLATPVILGLGNPDRDSTYDPRNSTEIYAPMFFVNGSFDTSAQFHIHVSDPSFKTIITKDLNVNNELIVDVEYNASLLPANWTQKDVPYFFVNGTMSYNQNQLYLGTGYSGDGMSGNQAPFNVFIGTADINCTGPVHIAGDLYLMDDDGDNVIAGGSTSQLYSWTSSMGDPAGSQFTPINSGGIYSKGNLTLKCGGTIEGDIRVEDDLIIDNNEPLTINGNVVARNIYLNGSKPVNCANGGSGVFCDTLSGSNAPAVQAINDSGMVFTYAEFIAGNPEGVYPNTMTREEIYGVDPTSSTLQEMYEGFVQPGSNRIISNQVELLEAIGYDNDRGDFTNYYTMLPSSVPVKEAANTYGEGWTNGTTDVVYIPHDAAVSGEIHINPVGTDFWVVIGDEGETTSWPAETRLILNDSAQVVNVMIQGDLQLGDRSAILCQSVANKITGQTTLGDIDQNTDHVNVMIYSNEGSQLNIGAQCLIAANALAPYMDLNGGTSAQWQVHDYISKYGTSPNWLGSGKQVTWIGNGLFNAVPNDINNFGFLKLDTGF